MSSFGITRKLVAMSRLRKLPEITLAALAIGCAFSATYFSTTPAHATPSSHPFKARTPNGLADGPGIWVNLWNYPTTDIDAYAQKLHSKGVRNLFVQTSRSNTESIRTPEILGQMIEACHRYKIKVIAWSFAELADPIRDANKLVDAAKFRTVHGEKFDAIAPNLEKCLSEPKVDAYSKHLRASLGNDYPMVAVVYSPLNGATPVATIPWKLLDKHYDVIAPMTYWNGKHQHLDAYTYTRRTIEMVRSKVGRSDVEIHAIGDGMGTKADSIQDFLRACRDLEATGASLYPNQRPTEEQLNCIVSHAQYFPPNARFRLAAYREMINQGKLVPPGHNDPSKPITRGEFYQLLVAQTHGGVMDAGEAAAQLHDMGVLSRTKSHMRSYTTPEEALSQSVSPLEALDLVAAIVDVKSRPYRPVKKTNKLLRPDRWFIQPAYAEISHQPLPETKPITYLDATQMVVEATVGLR